MLATLATKTPCGATRLSTAQMDMLLLCLVRPSGTHLSHYQRVWLLLPHRLGASSVQSSQLYQNMHFVDHAIRRDGLAGGTHPLGLHETPIAIGIRPHISWSAVYTEKETEDSQS